MPRATQPEVHAIAMARPTSHLPQITRAVVGRAPAPSAPRPPADISHPATVYRAVPEGERIPDTLIDAGIEESGSLTGQVLSRGRADAPGPPRSRIVFVILVIFVTVVVLALVGLTVAGATSDVVGSFFDRIAGR